MHKLTITASTAILALALMASAAIANSGISFSPTRTTLTFESARFEGGLGSPVSCSLTLDIELHPRTSKTAGTLTGLSDVGFNSCIDGTMGMLVGGRRVTGPQGPFHVTYQSFTGTLPNITSITFKVNDVVLWYRQAEIDCLTAGAIDVLGTTTGGNPATGVNIASTSAPLTGDFSCIFSDLDVSASGSLSAATRMTLF